MAGNENINERYSRTVNLVGEEGLAKLRSAKVLIIGNGGVGSYAAEAIGRSGVGSVTLMDGDTVQPSNLNRQLVALTSTLGRNKAEVMAERMKDIDPDTEVTALARFYKVDDELDLTQFDWVVDAIDDVNAKTALIKTAVEKGVNIISAMGAAGKFGTAFKVTDISKTSTCPLAKVMRKRLRDLGIEHLPVVYSKEKPIRPLEDMSISCRKHCICPPGTARKCTQRRDIPGSTAFVPSAAGLIIAGEVIKDLIEFDRGER